MLRGNFDGQWCSESFFPEGGGYHVWRNPKKPGGWIMTHSIKLSRNLAISGDVVVGRAGTHILMGNSTILKIAIEPLREASMCRIFVVGSDEKQTVSEFPGQTLCWE